MLIIYSGTMHLNSITYNLATNINGAATFNLKINLLEQQI